VTRRSARIPGCSALLGLLLLFAMPPATAAEPLPPLPPLLNPASDVRHPGKLVWADLFTSDIERSRDFFAGLFGWEWRWVNHEGEGRYGMFYNAGAAVAGLSQYQSATASDQPYARWAYYISVEDVDTVVARARELGAEVLLARRDVAERGAFAILADREKAAIGVIDSSSGDPDDYQAGFGDWLWHQLFSRDTGVAGPFYADLFGYKIHEPAKESEVVDLVLSKGGYARAGIGRLVEGSEALPTWLGMIRVQDLDAALEQVRSLGGEVVLEPSPELAGGLLAIATDPVGAPFGLIVWDYPEQAAGPEGSK